jgi:hypothetical protein
MLTSKKDFLLKAIYLMNCIMLIASNYLVQFR